MGSVEKTSLYVMYVFLGGATSLAHTIKVDNVTRLRKRSRLRSVSLVLRRQLDEIVALTSIIDCYLGDRPQAHAIQNFSAHITGNIGFYFRAFLWVRKP